MRSSSELFPVSLHRADIIGNHSEDVYLLKPNNSPDQSVQIAVSRIGKPEQPERGQPVVLLHGSFSNRGFWLNSNGVGLAAYLVDQGYDVWLPEARGHGLSPRNRDYKKNRLYDYVHYDLPAVQAFIEEQTQRKVHWVGHSLGGITLLAALSAGQLPAQGVGRVVLFGAQVRSMGWAFKLPLACTLSRLYLRRNDHVSGAKWGRGPEDEPRDIVLEALGWYSLFGRWQSRGENYWRSLEQVTSPVLNVSAQGDYMDPKGLGCRRLHERLGSAEKQHVHLGVANGQSQDFGHIEMLVSKAAAKEVWPLLVDWLK